MPLPAELARERATRLTPRRWARLLILPIFAEVHDRLLQGESARAVARMVQDEQEMLLDMTLDSLTTLLAAYRRDVIGIAGGLRREESPEAERLRELLDLELREPVNLAKHYEFLINVQARRLRRFAEIEEQPAGMLVADFPRAAEVFRQTLHDFAEFLGENGLGRLPDAPDGGPPDTLTALSRRGPELFKAAVRRYLDVMTEEVVETTAEVISDVEAPPPAPAASEEDPGDQ